MPSGVRIRRMDKLSDAGYRESIKDEIRDGKTVVLKDRETGEHTLATDLETFENVFDEVNIVDLD